MRTPPLWHKAWRESRGRFALGLAVIAVLCTVFIVFQSPIRGHFAPAARSSDNTFVAYVYRRVYAGFVRGMFLILTLVLGFGGLQRERRHGTIEFTLALPCSRRPHFLARAGVGMLQVATLALVPLLLVPTLSTLIGERYPLGQSLAFAALWIVIGWTVFAFSFLLSTCLRDEFAALCLALVVFYVYPLIVVYAPFLRGKPLHIHYIMNGTNMPYFDAASHRYVGPFPWMIAAGATCVTVAFLWISELVVTRRDLA